MDYPSPDALWELGDRISKDASLASVYKWNMSRNVAIPEEIKSSEQLGISCLIKTSNTDEEDRCNGVKRKLFDDPAEALVNMFEGDWVKKATSAS